MPKIKRTAATSDRRDAVMQRLRRWIREEVQAQLKQQQAKQQTGNSTVREHSGIESAWNPPWEDRGPSFSHGMPPGMAPHAMGPHVDPFARGGMPNPNQAHAHPGHQQPSVAPEPTPESRPGKRARTRRKSRNVSS